jgi:hypothetical protein
MDLLSYLLSLFLVFDLLKHLNCLLYEFILDFSCLVRWNWIPFLGVVNLLRWGCIILLFAISELIYVQELLILCLVC